MKSNKKHLKNTFKEKAGPLTTTQIIPKREGLWENCVQYEFFLLFVCKWALNRTHLTRTMTQLLSSSLIVTNDGVPSYIFLRFVYSQLVCVYMCLAQSIIFFFLFLYCLLELAGLRYSCVCFLFFFFCLLEFKGNELST